MLPEWALADKGNFSWSGFIGWKCYATWRSHGLSGVLIENPLRLKPHFDGKERQTDWRKARLMLIVAAL